MPRGRKRKPDGGAVDGAGAGLTYTTTTTRTCNLSLSMLPGVAADGSLLAGAEKQARQVQLRGNIDAEVRAVSVAMRNGSRMFELLLRRLLEAGGGLMPAPFPWNTATQQVMAAMKAKVGTKQVVVPGFAVAEAEWQGMWPRAVHGVRLLAHNSLTAECNGYFRTLLKNFTRIAIGAHTLWAARYLAPECGQTLKKLITGHARVGSAALPQAEYDAIPVHVRELATECLAIMAAKYDGALISRATELRWKMLGLVDALEADVRATGRLHQRLGKHGPVDVVPKRFTLVPQAAKASRFITIDAQVARCLLGLPAIAKPAEPPVFVQPLRLLFDSALTRKWTRNRKRRSVGDGDVFPATVKTDGVQLHIPFLRHHAGEATPQAEIDARQTSNVELRAQLASASPRGLFTIDAVGGAGLVHGRVNIVGVDPGVRYLVATSAGFKLSRNDYYGARPARTVFDPGAADARRYHGAVKRYSKREKDGRRDGAGHSPRSRRNQLPLPIHNLQQHLSLHATRAAGRNNGTFVANLGIWLQSSEALQAYHGSRTHRAMRLTRAANGRRALQSVVDNIALDPETIVAFGASFYGRVCRTGDVAGPVAVKGIRRHLAKHRVVVVIDEYNTTKMHLRCGCLLTPRADDRHEMWCAFCNQNVDRDGNAAQNIREVLIEHIRTGERPVHLRRPVTVPEPVVVVDAGDVVE